MMHFKFVLSHLYYIVCDLDKIEVIHNKPVETVLKIAKCVSISFEWHAYTVYT
jgi:hypothetical protein